MASDSSPTHWSHQFASSLWVKTSLAMLWGLAISISLTLNLSNSHWLAADTLLLVGILLAFTLWAMVMVYCLACNSLKLASLACLKVLLPSVILNSVQMLI